MDRSVVEDFRARTAADEDAFLRAVQRGCPGVRPQHLVCGEVVGTTCPATVVEKTIKGFSVQARRAASPPDGHLNPPEAPKRNEQRGPGAAGGAA